MEHFCVNLLGNDLRTVLKKCHTSLGSPENTVYTVLMINNLAALKPSSKKKTLNVIVFFLQHKKLAHPTAAKNNHS